MMISTTHHLLLPPGTVLMGKGSGHLLLVGVSEMLQVWLLVSGQSCILPLPDLLEFQSATLWPLKMPPLFPLR
jgi:hypothetical protein